MSRYTLQARSIGITAIGLFASLGIGSLASAGPLPGEVLKFQQLPLGDLQTNPNSLAPGHDELSTANLNTASAGFSGTFAADDFSDNVTSPVVDVQWWGSYLPLSNGLASNQIQHFLISFESDVPAPPGGFSTPGTSLSSEVVSLNPAPPLAAASGTFSETPVPALPGPDGPLYEYNAELANPFPEVAGTTYWLKIVALTGPGDGTEWGWHVRDYTIQDALAAPPGDVNLGTAANPVWHYEDDAVSGRLTYIPNQVLNEVGFAPLDYVNTTDGFQGQTVTPSEDLAFSLYYNPTVPEPVALPLLGAGMFLLRRQRRQARQA